MRKIRATVRRRNGTRPNTTRNEAGRSAMSKAFSEAKARRKGSLRSKTKDSSGTREETDGRNEDDHTKFVAEARKDDQESEAWS